MALSARIIRELRSEVGKSTEDAIDGDDVLETIYNAEGDSSILLTSWYVWKRRLNDLNEKSFDVTTGGSLMSRRQRTGYIQTRIAQLEFALGSVTEELNRAEADQDEILSTMQINAVVSGTELS